MVQHSTKGSCKVDKLDDVIRQIMYLKYPDLPCMGMEIMYVRVCVCVCALLLKGFALLKLILKDQGR